VASPAVWWRSASVVGAAAAAVVSAGALWALARATGPAPDFELFLGRFHPLVVHLPIGFLMLLGLVEALTLSPRLRPRIDPALGVLLPPLLAAAFASFVLGLLIARGGGYPAKLLALHRSFALATVIGTGACLVAWSEHRSRGGAASRALYRGLLGLTLLLISLTGHFGGGLTHGDGFLTRFAPGPIRRWLGGSSPATAEAASSATPAGAEPLVFRDVVAPALRERCVECHGPDKVSGGLRLDDFAALGKGGQDGPAVVPGRADKSLLVTRLQLPESNDEHMPPAGSPGLTPEQIEAIGWWVDRGASETLRVRDALPPDGARKVLAAGAAAASTANPTALLAPPADASGSAAAGPAGSASASSSAEPEPEVDGWYVEPGEKPSTPAAAKGSAWQQLVEPVLGARCGSCHGADKHKGGLRVDSLAAVLAGGKSGPGVVPGHPESGTVLGRMRLPSSAGGHMPPASEPQATGAEIELVAWWAEHGASADTLASAVPAKLHVAAAAGTPAATGKGGSEQHAAPGEASSGTPAAGSAAPQASAAASVAPAAGTAVTTAAAPSGSGEIQLYPKGVRPILTERCGSCHSGAGASGGLDVEQLRSMLDQGRVVPGDPAHSSLLSRVTSREADPDHMPPAGMAQVTPGEADVLRLWIAKGAREDVVVSAAELSASAQATLGAQPSAAAADVGHGAAAAGASKTSPEAKGGPAAPELERVPPTSAAGCAACAMARDASPPALALLGMGLLGAALPWRRLARRRLARRRR
jgi:uncharacterized membrane protein